jgi:hypothetical protein
MYQGLVYKYRWDLIHGKELKSEGMDRKGGEKHI